MAEEEAKTYAKQLAALYPERLGTAHIRVQVLADLDKAGVAVNKKEIIEKIIVTIDLNGR